MIRKLVMWQTNKERETEDYPAFVTHFTDYSPNRKTPLEREIRVSSSREQMDDLWKELVDENITKGWVQVVGGNPVAAPPNPVASKAVSAGDAALGEAAAIESMEAAEEKPVAKKKASPRKKKDA